MIKHESVRFLLKSVTRFTRLSDNFFQLCHSPLAQMKSAGREHTMDVFDLPGINTHDVFIYS